MTDPTRTGHPSLVETIGALTDLADDPEQRRRTMSVLPKYWAAVLGQDADSLRPLYSDDVLVELPFSESGRVEEGYFRSFRGIDEVMAFWATAFMLEGEDGGRTALR